MRRPARTLVAVEQVRDPDGAPGHGERDPDLVTLEGLESELGDLDAELSRVERDDAAAADD